MAGEENTKIVQFKEIAESPTLCLSAKRYIGGCLNCGYLLRQIRATLNRAKREGEQLTLDEAFKETVKNMECKPRIPEEQMEKVIGLLKRKQEIAEELKLLEREVEKEADGELNLLNAIVDEEEVP